jgi:hypothetical protein
MYIFVEASFHAALIAVHERFAAVLLLERISAQVAKKHGQFLPC